MGVEEYRERTVWTELALRAVMRKALRPSGEQLRAFYAERQAAYVEPGQARITQIFIAPAAGPDAEDMSGPREWADAEKRVVEAHSRLRMGEDFRAVASAYATGGSAPRWVGRGELLRELEDAAFSLKVGSMSGPIKTAMGYHIVRVEERRERKAPLFEEVEDRVRAEYEERIFAASAGEFMARLREKALRDGRLVLVDGPNLPLAGE